MNEEIGLEVIKLLLQQAWADEVLAKAEANYIRGVAARVCPSFAPTVERWLAKAEPLPMPNLGALVPVKDDVMRALANVTIADGVVHPEEQRVLHLIAELLDA